MAGGLEAVFAQGAAALEANDLPGAERIFRSIVEAEPRAHPAWNALSVVAVRCGLPDVAVEHAKHALELDRRNPVYLNNLGVAWGELGRFAEAEQAFLRALKARPAYAEGLFNLGKVLHKQGRAGEAARAFERAYAMAPAFPGLLPALAAAYRKEGRGDRVRALLEENAAGLQGDVFAQLWAASLAETDGAGAATTWLRDRIARQPEGNGLRYALAELLLAHGEWRAGWREYFWRPAFFDAREAAGERPPSPLPARLDGERVLLRGEQGPGDVLFFLRFAPLLRARGARTTLSCDRKIAAVITTREPLEAVREQAESDERADGFDRCIWCGDLPLLLEADAPPPAWPLAVAAADAARAKARLAALGPAPYLGLTWRAGTDTLRRREFGNLRSLLMKELPPAELGAALRGWQGTLLALQRAPHAGEIEAVAAAAGAPVHDLSALNDDLPAMLAVLGLLDEHVAVSNTNVHLRASLGRSTRVLVPHPPEWRWMHAGGSPWFPGFPLYREPASRGWQKPLADLRKDLSS